MSLSDLSHFQEEMICFVCLADLFGINSPFTADPSSPTWWHWRQSWEEMHKKTSSLTQQEPAPHTAALQPTAPARHPPWASVSHIKPPLLEISFLQFQLNTFISKSPPLIFSIIPDLDVRQSYLIPTCSSARKSSSAIGILSLQKLIEVFWSYCHISLNKSIYFYQIWSSCGITRI